MNISSGIKSALLFVCASCPLFAFAANTISGTVRNQTTGKAAPAMRSSCSVCKTAWKKKPGRGPMPKAHFVWHFSQPILRTLSGYCIRESITIRA